MKAVWEKVKTSETNSVVLRKLELPQFDAPFHFHPECELTLILKGEGQRYVGYQAADFFEGDLVFLGPNIPHCWINEVKGEEMVSAIVIQFEETFAGETFLSLPEMSQIKHFLARSASGFQILGQSRQRIALKMKQLVTANPLQRVTGLLEILAELGQSSELQAFEMPTTFRLAESERLQQVFSFMIEHFREAISLETVSSLAGLTPTSFCRYFKGVSGMTFSEALHDYRIQYACRLLQWTEMPVQSVAFESGFGDVPHFNRLFRKKKGLTPKMYRLQTKVN